jgi:lipopolysaccharide transport system permease protein
VNLSQTVESRVLIGAERAGILPQLSEVWRSRELLLFFVWRDVTVRYKQTALGVSWAVLQPLLAMTVMTVVFGFLARVPSGNVPYPVFALCGILPWQLCASAFNGASNSLLSNERLITKVYFPRLILPIAAALAALVDLILALPILLAVMAWYRLAPGAGLWHLPAFILLVLLTALSLGIGLAAVNVRYRDVRHVLPFLTQIWMLATPVIYPSTLVPPRWRGWLGLNPLAGSVEGFRWCLLGGSGPPPWSMVATAAVVVLALLAVSLAYFVRAEPTFADVA